MNDDFGDIFGQLELINRRIDQLNQVANLYRAERDDLENHMVVARAIIAKVIDLLEAGPGFASDALFELKALDVMLSGKGES